MDIGIQDVLTQAGATVLITILLGVIKVTVPNFDSARFGALTAIVLGLIVVIGANVTAVAEVQLGVGEAVLLGILSGAAAAGIYTAGRATTSSVPPAG